MEEASLQLFEVEVDSELEPSADDLLEYALFLGIDPEKEEHLLPLAEEGILAKLPAEWKLCQDQKGEYLYYNQESGQISQDNPMDILFRDKVRQARRHSSSS